MGVWDTITKWALDQVSGLLKRKANRIYKPVERLRQLVAGHELELPQLLRYVPGEWAWSLANLKDDDSLLVSLTADRIAWLARWFGVRREWLEGQGDRIYERLFGYGNLRGLIGQMAERGLFDGVPETVILADERSLPLDMHAGSRQSFVVVFSTAIATIGEQAIRRYVICGDAWDWRHATCRLDVKALARRLWQRQKASIPIIGIRGSLLRRIREGRVFPGPLVPFCIGGFDHLEDYILLPEESLVARETEEMPLVLRHAMTERGPVLLPVAQETERPPCPAPSPDASCPCRCCRSAARSPAGR